MFKRIDGRKGLKLSRSAVHHARSDSLSSNFNDRFNESEIVGDSLGSS